MTATPSKARQVAVLERLSDACLSRRLTPAECGEFYEAIRALRQGGEAWQPIATAPKDGTTVLLYSPDRCGNCPEGTSGIGNARWLGEKWITGRLLTGAFVKVAHQPTHWQPLPTPPAEGEAA